MQYCSAEEMTAFVKDVAPAFQRAYAKLYSYVIAFLQINLQSEFSVAGDGRQASFHSMAEGSCWSSSLRHCISEIRGKRWFPLRHKVISLGLHLNMNVEAINKMLGYAQMEPLYAKNPVEAAVMWAINEAQLCSEDDEIIPDGSSNLCLFVPVPFCKGHFGAAGTDRGRKLLIRGLVGSGRKENNGNADRECQPGHP